MSLSQSQSFWIKFGQFYRFLISRCRRPETGAVFQERTTACRAGHLTVVTRSGTPNTWPVSRASFESDPNALLTISPRAKALTYWTLHNPSTRLATSENRLIPLIICPESHITHAHSPQSFMILHIMHCIWNHKLIYQPKKSCFLRLNLTFWGSRSLYSRCTTVV